METEFNHGRRFLVARAKRLIRSVFHIYHYLSGETQKVETDRVAVGTFSGEGLSLQCFRNVPLSQSWMKPTKPKSTRRLKRNTVAIRLRHPALQRGCVASTLVCVKVCVKTGARKSRNA